LSGVIASDAGNVALTAIAVYDNANVGTGKTITVTYGLTGSAAGNYTVPTAYSVNTGVITAQVLNSTPSTITTKKAYDGNNSAAVTPGILSGVLASDAGNVA